MVSDARAARVLVSESKRRLLLLFSKPRSVSEVAALAEEPIGKVHYHVLEFVRLGLLALESETKRAGRPIKRYRTVADSFFVPAELIPVPETQDLLAELREALEETKAKADLRAVTIRADEKGNPLLEASAPTARNVAAFESWQILQLSEAEAMRLAQELRDLLRTYEDASSSGGTFIVHAALAPTRRRSRR